MKIKSSIGFLFLLVVTGAIPAFAQKRSCPLDLSVIKFQTKPDDAEIPVSGATATATNLRSKKLFRATLLEGMPRFAKLPEGKFTIAVTRAGYKRTTKEVDVNCKGLAEDGSNSEVIYLLKGSSGQTYKMSGIIIGNADAMPVRRDVKTVLGDVNTNSPPVSNDSMPVQMTNRPIPKMVSGGVLNAKSTNLVKPEYPKAARAVKASGAVNVQVTIDEEGSVISATAVSGHPLLRMAAEKAARESKFSRTLLSGQPVKVTGVIVYNFVP
ncbi:MAG TPA: energy transducer TonB [Pyrinomonadaceae bacterium]|jgi:TonB family protein